MRTRKMTDRMLLEGLVNKYGAKRLTNVINKMNESTSFSIDDFESWIEDWCDECIYEIGAFEDEDEFREACYVDPNRVISDYEDQNDLKLTINERTIIKKWIRENCR